MIKRKDSHYQLLNKIPSELGIFCHNRALLLPGAEINLNIYESKYLNLVENAIEINNRFFGFVSPKPKNKYEGVIGCLAKIVSFTEFEDQHFHITIQGIMRFEILQSVATRLPYKVVDVSYDDFLNDIDFEKIRLSNRANVDDIVHQYVEIVEGNNLELEKISAIPDIKIFSFLCNNIDFRDEEKKQLLEAESFAEVQFIVENAANLAIASSESKKHNKH